MSLVAAADDMLLDEGHERQVAVVAHHFCSSMMWGELLMKGFAGFWLLVMICWAPGAFVGVDATIFGPVPTGVRATTD